MSVGRSLLAAILVVSPLVAQRPAALPRPLRGLDAYVVAALRDWDVPGLSVAVVKDDSVVLARGFGVRRLGDTTRVTERTLFAIASCTKAFTAAALAMLVDSGKVAWDDPVSKYLTGFQLADPYVTRELTVRDLLTHRFLKPSWSFRSRYGYQNIMFLAAGQIVPTAAGQSWDDFVRRHIFTPLGMTATNTSVAQLPAGGDVATPHEHFQGVLRAISWRNVDNVGPAGSINSNAIDMAQWIRLQLGNGVYRGQRLVSEAAVKEMRSPQTVIPLDSITERLRPSTHFLAYGLGWALADYRGRKLVSHGGALDGMRSIVMLVPEERLGIAEQRRRGGTTTDGGRGDARGGQLPGSAGRRLERQLPPGLQERSGARPRRSAEAGLDARFRDQAVARRRALRGDLSQRNVRGRHRDGRQQPPRVGIRPVPGGRPRPLALRHVQGHLARPGGRH